MVFRLPFLFAASALFLLNSNTIQGDEIHHSEHYELQVKTLTQGLEHPWGMDFLPDGSLLVTERDGRLRHFKNGSLSDPIRGLPPIAAKGQGGLLDVAVSPDFSTTRYIFFTYTEPAADEETQGTALARATFVVSPKPHLENMTVIFTQNKKTETGHHFGSRIVFAPDGTLFFTIGDRGNRPRAQDPFDHAGSVLRLNADGSIPIDNPFADGKSAAPEIWSIGHRNPQGATLNRKTGQLWTVEHGARGGDEINRPQKSRNYGWPVISYGRHYSGFKIGVGTHKEGMEQPIYYWDPSIAPSGLAYYDGSAFEKWQGNLFVGALKFELLVRLEMEGDTVLHEERLLTEQYGRIRDVRQGPDGFLYVLTDEPDGKILRISPAQ